MRPIDYQKEGYNTPAFNEARDNCKTCQCRECKHIGCRMVPCPATGCLAPVKACPDGPIVVVAHYEDIPQEVEKAFNESVEIAEKGYKAEGPKQKQSKEDLLLDILYENEGLEGLEEMAERALFDSTCPGICTRDGCGYTTDVEPDNDRGWCEICGTNTVKSGLVLAGWM